MNFLKYSLIAILFLAIGVGSTVYFIKMKPELLGLSVSQAQAQADSDKLVSEVSLLIALPTDEKPTIATVSDITKVQDQPFFKSAKNGDKVLIYTNAKKAILYRPGEKRIIEVGAVNINNNQQTEVTASPTPSASPTSAQ